MANLLQTKRITMLGDTQKPATVGVGRIAKAMTGTCPYSIWRDMREPKQEEENERLAKWREQHDALVDLFIEEFKDSNPGWVVVTEHEISHEGMAGRIDVLARGKGNKFQIWEIKTGKKYPYHQRQLDLYLAMEKHHNPDAEIHGYLRYIDGQSNISDASDKRPLLLEALDVKEVLLQDIPPGKKYCDDCRWCSYKDSTCPRS
jgi:CRISPR/Cas system-associated exonuclease Cas4 (RecB family)